MAIISVPFTFSAGAVIIASQHNSCFSTIYSDYNGNITGDNIATSAAIAYSKLNLTGSILNADINTSAAIVGSKLDLTSPGAIGSTSANTGAFSTLKVGTTHQGDILYDNGTSLIRLTPGTSGQGLITQGSSANPIWGAVGSYKFISSTPVTAANTSGNITIAASKNYLILYRININSGSNTQLSLRFNADNSSSYDYVFSGDGSSANIAAVRATGQTSILLGGVAAAGGEQIGKLDINFGANTSANLEINGIVKGDFSTNSNRGYVNLFGHWSNAAVTSFSILGDQTYSGTILLYELSQS